MQINKCPMSCGEFVDILSSPSSLPWYSAKTRWLIPLHPLFPSPESTLHKTPVNCKLADAPSLKPRQWRAIALRLKFHFLTMSEEVSLICFSSTLFYLPYSWSSFQTCTALFLLFRLTTPFLANDRVHAFMLLGSPHRSCLPLPPLLCLHHP